MCFCVCRPFRSVKRVLSVGGCSSKTCWFQRCTGSPSTPCCWTASSNTQRVRNREMRHITSTWKNTYETWDTLLLPQAGSPDLALLQRAHACCRGILQGVDAIVGETEHQQRLNQYQRRLDAAPQFKVAAQLMLSPRLHIVIKNTGFFFTLFFFFFLTEFGSFHQEVDSWRFSHLETQ